MEITSWIFIVAGVLLLIFLVLYLWTRSKGKIEIKLSQFNFSPGDIIDGEIILRLKKPTQADSLQVGLIGEQRQTRYRGGRSSTSTKRVFDFQQNLDGKKEYQSGEKSYPFKIKVPQDLFVGLCEKLFKFE